MEREMERQMCLLHHRSGLRPLEIQKLLMGLEQAQDTLPRACLLHLQCQEHLIFRFGLPAL